MAKLKRGNLKTPDANFLKSKGYKDIHQLKDEMLKGKKNREPVSHYDIRVDKNGALVLMKKNGEIIEVGLP